MEEELQRHEVCPVENVPRLYLTDWVGASSVAEDNILGITHILSILSVEESPRYGPPKVRGIKLRQLNIEDEAEEDILQYLGDRCEWLDHVLARPNTAVIVHCQQGVSRSAALIIAYLVRKFGLSFDDAVRSIKKTRGIVNINAGFEEQLRLWERCRGDIYMQGTHTADGKHRKTKPEYAVWKQRRKITSLKTSVSEPSSPERGRNSPVEKKTASPRAEVKEIEALGVIDFVEDLRRSTSRERKGKDEKLDAHKRQLEE